MTLPGPSLSSSWFVVARSRQLLHKPLAVTLLGRSLAIARLPEGELIALEDCCPHRLLPLSMGCVTEHGLRCAYHGWTFNAQGDCVSVPGLTSCASQPNARTRPASIIEAGGLIWVRLEPGHPSEVNPLPSFLKRLPSQSLRYVWQSSWRASAIDALENFLDAQHTHFVHPALVRTNAQRRVVQATVRRSEGFLQVDYQGPHDQSGWLYRLFESPREVERAHFCATAAGTAQLEYRYRNGSAVYFTLHFSPVNDNETRVHGTCHIEGRWAPTWVLSVFVWPFLRRVLAQDQAIVEAQAENKRRFGRSRGVSSELDLVRTTLEEVWLDRRPAQAESTHVVTMLI